MAYYIAKTVSGTFDSVVADVTARLKSLGFGILSDIDVQATLKTKIGADMPKYRILGDCNPRFAREALKLEDEARRALPGRSGRHWRLRGTPRGFVRRVAACFASCARKRTVAGVRQSA